MFIALISIIIFVCVLLVLVVLAQEPKGGGLSSQFGGSGSSNLIGVKRTGDLLEKLTWGFAIAVIVLTLTSHTMVGTSNEGGPVRSINEERAQQEASPAAPVAPAPVPQQGGATNNAAEIPDAGDIPAMVDSAQ